MHCDECRWWKVLDMSFQPHSKNPEEPHALIVGECRRHAPHPSVELLLAAAKWHDYEADGELDVNTDIPKADILSEWPLTDRADWCGDFAEKTR